MADSLKRAVPAKAPRPAAGAPARPFEDDPLTRPGPPPFVLPQVQSRPPPSQSQSQPRSQPKPQLIPTPLPAAGVTAATDMLVGKVAAPVAATRTGDLSAPTAGDRVGKYIIEKLLGSGGMGLVVAARHEDTNDLVAIKLLRPKAAGDKIHAERFAREARAIVKIKSPHVVKVFDAGTLPNGDMPFIVMEHLEGRDLAQIIREEGALPLMHAADIMLQVCDAVAAAHAVGVIHRDLKPSNFVVITRPDGRPHVKVLDFGIAKAIGTDGVVDPNLTETQAVFGSPTYMSPEQIRSAKHVDHRSDVWSIGVGLYEVTTGRLPFSADNVAGLLASIVADPPYYPRGFVPDLPPVFEDLVLACLHKDAKQRVQSVGDLGVALAPFATPGPDTDRLVASITTLSPPTGQVFPGETGPRLPMASNPLFQQMPLGAAGSGPYNLQSPGYASEPSWPGLAPPEDQRVSGVVFGSTGSDLHGIPRPVGKKAGTTIGILLAVAVVVVAAGGAVYYKKPSVFGGQKAAPSQTASQSAPQAAVSVAADPITPASAPVTTAPPASAPSTSTDPSGKPSGTATKLRPKHPGTTGPGAVPAPAPGPKKAVDPTGDRL